MQINQAAAATGLTPETIRFYERRGVLPPPARQPNGYRDYSEQHVRVLRVAAALRQLAVPLDAAARILSVLHDGTCGDVRDRMVDTFETVLDDIEERLRRLRELRRQMKELVDGLRDMPPDALTVPCVDACACSQLVTGG